MSFQHRLALNSPIRTLTAGLAALSLAGCGVISARLAAKPVERVTAIEASQPCTAPEGIEKRLAGAFLRQSSAAGPTFVPVLLTGRDNKNGLAADLTFNDEAQTLDVEGIPGTVVIGPRDATAKARPGFGQPGLLPNVYDVSYDIDDITFAGPLVIGSGTFVYEVPSSGGVVFSGRIALEIEEILASGDTRTTRTEGQFNLTAGYGSGRGLLTATGFDASLPFDTLSWSNLFLCGTRFVSSGKGVVTVSREGGAAISPFKADRDPAPFRALFESSLLAAPERPAPPVGIGGVFVIQSDNGTMTAVFLSNQPAPESVIIEEEDADA